MAFELVALDLRRPELRLKILDQVLEDQLIVSPEGGFQGAGLPVRVRDVTRDLQASLLDPGWIGRRSDKLHTDLHGVEPVVLEHHDTPVQRGSEIAGRLLHRRDVVVVFEEGVELSSRTGNSRQIGSPTMSLNLSCFGMDYPDPDAFLASNCPDAPGAATNSTATNAAKCLQVIMISFQTVSKSRSRPGESRVLLCTPPSRGRVASMAAVG